ncbi:hypothetical protein KF840_13645 [bacterium]|nr:hypothetical protein [bacterium]
MAYEIRPMSVGEILDTGFRLLRNHFGPLVAIAAIAYGPLGVLQLALVRVTGGGHGQAGAMLAPLLVVVGLMMLVVFVAFPLASTAMTMALGDLYVGRSSSAGQALRQSWGILLPVVGTGLLSSVLIGLGMLLLVLPGIWLVFAYWVSTQVMVIERIFGMAALRRSSALMKGNKGRGFVIGFVAMMLMSVVSSGATWALNAWPSVNAIASTIVGIVTYAFLYAVNVVFYFDVRCRREAFDLEHLARLVEQRGAVPAVAAL